MLLKKFTKILILISSGICIILTVFYIFPKQKSNDTNYQTFVVAKAKIHKGEKLTFDNSTIANLDLKESDFLFIKNENFNQFDGLIAKFDVQKNQPLLISDFIDETSLEYQIPKGKRLYILDIPIGPIVSVLKTDDFVDVIAHINMPGLKNVTETILDGVKLVNINDSENHEENSKYLSFYLTPDEVKILSFIKSYSEFSVVLRNPNDTSLNDTQPMTFNRFIQNDKIKKIINSDTFRIVSGKTMKTIEQP